MQLYCKIFLKWQAKIRSNALFEVKGRIFSVHGYRVGHDFTNEQYTGFTVHTYFSYLIIFEIDKRVFIYIWIDTKKIHTERYQRCL